MSSRRLAHTLAALLLLLLGAPAGAAPILYIDDAFGAIGTVDVATGASTVIGRAGIQLTDIAFSPSGNLFGAGFSSLYSINTGTGVATLIGNFGVNNVNALVFASNGTLYAAGGSSLYSVNPVTGAATTLGSLPANSAGDLAFNGGTLYLSSTTNTLVRIDLQNLANSTIVGGFGFSSVLGMATAEDGVLYGVAGTQVFSINTATGAGTLRSNYSGGILANAQGSAFLAEAVVPEQAAGILLPTAIGALTGWIRWRRRIGSGGRSSSASTATRSASCTRI